MSQIKNLHKNRYGEMEAECFFQYFNKDILLEIESDVSVEYAEKQVEYLNSMEEDIISEICKYSLLFCKEFMRAYPDIDYPEGMGEIENDKDILRFMSIDRLYVEHCKPENENVKVLNLSGCCAWDEENGIQWLIKDGKVIYVGTWDDLSLWNSDLNNPITNYILR